MRFLLCGEDEELSRLHAALTERAHDAEVFSTWQLADQAGAIQRADAIFVATREDDVDPFVAFLRRARESNVPVAVVPPCSDAYVTHLEIESALSSEGQPPQQFVAICGHPAFDALRGLLATPHSDIGQVETVTWTRPLSSTEDADTLAQFARDAIALASICGRSQELLAQAAPTGGRELAHLRVTLRNDTGPEVRWESTATPGSQPQVTLAGPLGMATLQMPLDGPWQLTTQKHTGGEPAVETFTAGAEYDALFAMLQDNPKDQGGALGPWRKACEALELADTIEISIRKRRAIDVFHLELTESTSFKGRMAMFGCLLIVAVPLLVVGMGVIADALQIPWLKDLRWDVLLLIVLAAFLAAQGLIVLARSDQSQE